MEQRPSEDPTRASDISYYRDSAFSRLLSAQAAERARHARRDALLLAVLGAGVFLLWAFREELFGTDVPVRVVDQLTGYTYTGETGADGSLTMNDLYAGEYIVWIENNRDVCGPRFAVLEAGGQHHIAQGEQFCLLLPLISTR